MRRIYIEKYYSREKSERPARRFDLVRHDQTLRKQLELGRQKMKAFPEYQAHISKSIEIGIKQFEQELLADTDGQIHKKLENEISNLEKELEKFNKLEFMVKERYNRNIQVYNDRHPKEALQKLPLREDIQEKAKECRRQQKSLLAESKGLLESGSEYRKYIQKMVKIGILQAQKDQSTGMVRQKLENEILKLEEECENCQAIKETIKAFNEKSRQYNEVLPDYAKMNMDLMVPNLPIGEKMLEGAKSAEQKKIESLIKEQKDILGGQDYKNYVMLSRKIGEMDYQFSALFGDLHARFCYNAEDIPSHLKHEFGDLLQRFREPNQDSELEQEFETRLETHGVSLSDEERKYLRAYQDCAPKLTQSRNNLAVRYQRIEQRVEAYNQEVEPYKSQGCLGGKLRQLPLSEDIQEIATWCDWNQQPGSSGWLSPDVLDPREVFKDRTE